MSRPWYSIKALASGSTDTAEVSIFGEIGIGALTATTFIADFRAITASKVLLLINSPGGSVFDGLAMFNAMAASGKHIEARVMGIAASMASYLAMVADKITMPANTMMMIHNPGVAAQGNADDLRGTADVLDKIGASLTATYAKRFKGPAATLNKMLADETFLTAAECKTYGLCDEVTAEIPVRAEFNVTQLPKSVQALFKPAPLSAEALADAVRGLAKNAGLEAFTDVFIADPAATSLEAAATVVNTAREVQAIAKHCRLPEQAEALIRARSTLPEARAALAEALAEADVATHINTARKSTDMQPKSTDSFSPQSLWAEIHASTGKNRSKTK